MSCNARHLAGFYMMGVFTDGNVLREHRQKKKIVMLSGFSSFRRVGVGWGEGVNKFVKKGSSVRKIVFQIMFNESLKRYKK